MPPAQVGQLSETVAETEAHEPRAKPVKSTSVGAKNRWIMPAA